MLRAATPTFALLCLKKWGEMWEKNDEVNRAHDRSGAKEATQCSAEMVEEISEVQVVQLGRDTNFRKIIHNKIMAKIIFDGERVGSQKNADAEEQ